MNKNQAMIENEKFLSQCAAGDCHADEDLIFVDATVTGMADYRNYCPHHFEAYTLNCAQRRAERALARHMDRISKLNAEVETLSAGLPARVKAVTDASDALMEFADVL